MVVDESFQNSSEVRNVEFITSQFPFSRFFENAPQPLFKGVCWEEDLAIAEGCMRHIEVRKIECSSYSCSSLYGQCCFITCMCEWMNVSVYEDVRIRSIKQHNDAFIYKRLHSPTAFCCSDYSLDFLIFVRLSFLRSSHDRNNYLMTKLARVVAMTCTHAAMKRYNGVHVCIYVCMYVCMVLLFCC